MAGLNLGGLRSPGLGRRSRKALMGTGTAAVMMLQVGARRHFRIRSARREGRGNTAQRSAVSPPDPAGLFNEDGGVIKLHI